MEGKETFLGDDPGASVHGNFINYYQFHPAKHRVCLSVKDIWQARIPKDVLILDIGCNAGDLTQYVYECLKKDAINNGTSCQGKEIETRKSGEMYIIGVDLDPILIQRANESNKYTNNVFYECLDVMSDSRDKRLAEILKRFNKDSFDCVFCFSTTMWIHLNHGDDGLKTFLLFLCKWSNIVVVEPQPWKCYKAAERRLKKAGRKFEKFPNLKMGRQVESDVHYVFTTWGYEKVFESTYSKWGRKTFVYKKKI